MVLLCPLGDSVLQIRDELFCCFFGRHLLILYGVVGACNGVGDRRVTAGWPCHWLGGVRNLLEQLDVFLLPRARVAAVHLHGLELVDRHHTIVGLVDIGGARILGEEVDPGDCRWNEVRRAGCTDRDSVGAKIHPVLPSSPVG